MYFSHRIKKVIEFNIDGARIAIGVCYDHRDITHVTDIGRLITGEPCSTRVTRRVADEVDCIFLAVFHTVTVGCIVDAGIIPPYAEAALIPVIGTDRTRRIETAVRCLLVSKQLSVAS
jgi:hypothetical protein